jgi:hypothetical protein
MQQMKMHSADVERERKRYYELQEQFELLFT